MLVVIEQELVCTWPLPQTLHMTQLEVLELAKVCPVTQATHCPRVPLGRPGLQTQRRPVASGTVSVPFAHSIALTVSGVGLVLNPVPVNTMGLPPAFMVSVCFPTRWLHCSGTATE